MADNSKIDVKRINVFEGVIITYILNTFVEKELEYAEEKDSKVYLSALRKFKCDLEELKRRIE